MASDQELLKAAQAGETTALVELFTRHQGPVGHFFSQSVRSRQDAEDLQQEAFLLAFRKLDQCKQSFGGWVRMIAVNLVKDHYRDAKRPPPISRADIEFLADSHTSNKDEAQRLVEELLEQLRQDHPQKADSVFQYFFDSRNFREIGEADGVSESTARYRVQSGIDYLRNRILDNGDDRKPK